MSLMLAKCFLKQAMQSVEFHHVQHVMVHVVTVRHLLSFQKFLFSIQDTSSLNLKNSVMVLVIMT
eukprot:m.434051 g.434051  ORF g.434051 m.434051 type:complete len:65 (+) comp95917_c0_seq1:552-746(+)